ncbi:DUF3307 domain-containing protein [Desulfobulbus rhabdoformis]|jgi:hypothetical protein|uniref:DUF3307 domain-containing protein n=1 Tax=Desulfobulbus rhabdoformis TaxID=34032 RepID=UPI001964136E|nr:DUF3307 domain-containing protein [Desulfobulbus rhabdoformis]MBM9614504.1 DUF3307 domain-containing protein [Desulfobulbus rhabdoformis]
MIQFDTQLLALICGHFCGDFILQSERMVTLKQTHSLWMCAHAAIVALITWLLLGNLSAWWLMTIIAATHLLIDTYKIRINSERMQTAAVPPGAAEQRTGDNASNSHYSRIFFWFFFDQALHLLVLILLWSLLRSDSGSLFAYNSWSLLWGSDYSKALILVTGLALGVCAVGVVLKMQMAQLASALPNISSRGLPRGGKTIGTLERLLVFLFVLAGRPEGIGFVVAAKSVFRIGDLTNRAERDQAEYIMIGTLRSFTYALVFAFTTQWLIRQVG